MSKQVIWIHAVSVGEVQAAKPLVTYLLKAYPEYKILLTTVTVTGASTVANLFNDSVIHHYLPYDHPIIISRFLNRAKPSILVVMETEIWPVLYKHCSRKQIPIVIINARLSDRSFGRYLKLGRLTSQTLDHVSDILTQSQTDAERFMKLLPAPEKVSVIKNIKFDAVEIPTPGGNQHELRSHFNRETVILAASTHPGEEAILASVFKELDISSNGNLYLIVPRHPQRAKEIISIVKAAGLKPGLYSDKSTWQADCNLLIVDTIGDLQQLYLISDIVIMGGSFVPIGGHNMIEPSMASRAIITGPHVENFREVFQLLNDAGGIRQVQGEVELVNVVQELLTGTNTRQEMGNRAYQVVIQNQGGINEITTVIDRYLVNKD